MPRRPARRAPPRARRATRSPATAGWPRADLRAVRARRRSTRRTRRRRRARRGRSTRTWRCRSSHGNTSDAMRVGGQLAALARLVVGEEARGRASSRPLSRTVRARGRPSASAVASTIALGSSTPAACASSEPAPQLLEPGRREVALARGRRGVAAAHAARCWRSGIGRLGHAGRASGALVARAPSCCQQPADLEGQGVGIGVLDEERVGAGVARQRRGRARRRGR